MNKSILIGLIAAAITPVVANAHPNGNREGRHEHRAEARHADRQAVRHDVRHDRRAARHHNRHWTAYRAPSQNWAYRPLSVGYQLRPAFYEPRYAISDYGAFRVRAPGRNMRWIRYGDDLLLVNVRTGRVLDVVHNRYW